MNDKNSFIPLNSYLYHSMNAFIYASRVDNSCFVTHFLRISNDPRSQKRLQILFWENLLRKTGKLTSTFPKLSSNASLSHPHSIFSKKMFIILQKGFHKIFVFSHFKKSVNIIPEWLPRKIIKSPCNNCSFSYTRSQISSKKWSNKSRAVL